MGLVALFAIGAASTRPPGTAVATALLGCGLDITRLELVEATGVRGRQYAGSGPVGLLDVRVLERDTFGEIPIPVEPRIAQLRSRDHWDRFDDGFVGSPAQALLGANYIRQRELSGSKTKSANF